MQGVGRALTWCCVHLAHKQSTPVSLTPPHGLRRRVPLVCTYVRTYMVYKCQVDTLTSYNSTQWTLRGHAGVAKVC